MLYNVYVKKVLISIGPKTLRKKRKATIYFKYLQKLKADL